jgi:hypothetical protein
LPSEPIPGQADGGRALHSALRRGLTTALKARDSDAIAALRVAIAAIDNAEAVPAPATNSPITSAHVAGSRGGVGSTEAVRRQLSVGELRHVLEGQIAEHSREAERYDALGHADAAERLRRQARTLAPYLADDSTASHGQGTLLPPPDDRSVDGNCFDREYATLIFIRSRGAGSWRGGVAAFYLNAKRSLNCSRKG